MHKLLTIALQLASGAFSLLSDDDKDAIIDAIEIKLVERRGQFPDKAGRYRAAMVALRAVRGLLGIPDEAGEDQLNPV